MQINKITTARKPDSWTRVQHQLTAKAGSTDPECKYARNGDWTNIPAVMSAADRSTSPESVPHRSLTSNAGGGGADAPLHPLLRCTRCSECSGCSECSRRHRPHRPHRHRRVRSPQSTGLPLRSPSPAELFIVYLSSKEAQIVPCTHLRHQLYRLSAHK